MIGNRLKCIFVFLDFWRKCLQVHAIQEILLLWGEILKNKHFFSLFLSKISRNSQKFEKMFAL